MHRQRYPKHTKAPRIVVFPYWAPIMIHSIPILSQTHKNMRQYSNVFLTRSFLFVLILFLLTLFSVSSHSAFANTYPTGTLKTNQYLIQLINDNQTRKYTVYDHNGNLILKASTEKELIATLPELRSLITESTAFKDASLTVPDATPEFK